MSGLVICGLAAIAFVAFATEAALGFAGTVLTMSLGAQLVPLDVLLPVFVPINLLLSLSIALVDWRQIEWRALFVELSPPVAIGAGTSKPRRSSPSAIARSRRAFEGRRK